MAFRGFSDQEKKGLLAGKKIFDFYIPVISADFHWNFPQIVSFWRGSSGLLILCLAPKPNVPPWSPLSSGWNFCPVPSQWYEFSIDQTSNSKMTWWCLCLLGWISPASWKKNRFPYSTVNWWAHTKLVYLTSSIWKSCQYVPENTVYFIHLHSVHWYKNSIHLTTSF